MSDLYADSDDSTWSVIQEGRTFYVVDGDGRRVVYQCGWGSREWAEADMAAAIVRRASL